MSPRTKPGETRERVYRFVRERLEVGQSPTVREIQKEFGFRAVQTAHEHLEKLVAEGRLAKRAGEARGYCLPGGQLPGPPPALVPLLGRVQAGALSTAVEDLEGHIPAKSKSSEDLFALTVRGGSMIEAGILPGDVVIVRSQPTAESGEIVVALNQALNQGNPQIRQQLHLSHFESVGFDDYQDILDVESFAIDAGYHELN